MKNKIIYKVFVKESKNSGYSEVFENMEEVLINIKSISEFEEIKIAPQIEGHEIKTIDSLSSV